QIKNIDKYIPHKNPFTHERLQTKSIFNQNPKLVPKSTSLSLEAKEQQRKQSITHYGKDITIKKDSNGNCSMTQNLSSVGIEGVKATQYFKCGGRTQFEKNFSEHMKASMKRYQ
ncbi:MAG: hypothetical protein ABJG28_01850, partial [Nonlabens ulvanivorans]|uniref:hypothetical protein n=1 Tax=Nonlabens ulvanivorans TaxID=906888 RepID=UPI0032669DB2